MFYRQRKQELDEKEHNLLIGFAQLQSVRWALLNLQKDHPEIDNPIDHAKWVHAGIDAILNMVDQHSDKNAMYATIRQTCNLNGAPFFPKVLQSAIQQRFIKQALEEEK